MTTKISIIKAKNRFPSPCERIIFHDFLQFQNYFARKIEKGRITKHFDAV